MFDFIRKHRLWQAWNEGLDKEIGATKNFNLKSAQDVVVYAFLRNISGKVIGEVGGGMSRILPALAAANQCFNIDKFEGADGGPSEEVKVLGVSNIRAFLGEFSCCLKTEFFDVVFSISVVEHVPDLKAFLDDGLRILKSGGLWLHAIDLYIEDESSAGRMSRFDAYRGWFDNCLLVPLGPVYPGPAKFTCDLVTNPDNQMYRRDRIAPRLAGLRERAQSVSLLIAGRKG